jgi:hypothetical protein
MMITCIAHIAFLNALLFCTSTNSMDIGAPALSNHRQKTSLEDLSLLPPDGPGAHGTFTMTNFSYELGCD